MLGNNALVQNAIEQQVNEQVIEQDQLGFSPLKIYFGDDFQVTDKITIHTISIQDIIDYGEVDLYRTLEPFISNTTKYRVQLWDMGIDWNKISNQELFLILLNNINSPYSIKLFGEIDFSKFILQKIGVREDGSDILSLYSPEQDIEITEETQEKMSKYIQYMFGMYPPQEEFVSGKQLKMDLINNDRQKQMLRKKELSNQTGTVLLSQISFCVNHPGFKYKKDELREVNFNEFIDSVQRLLVYESTHALYIGMNSGFVDTSKIKDKERFNFMRVPTDGTENA